MRLTAHSDRIWSINEFFSQGEAAQMIALAEQAGFSAAEVRAIDGPRHMPMIRNNERVVVTALTWVALMWQRLAPLALPALQGETPKALPRELRFYMYSSGQRFKMHKDGP